MLRFVFIIGLIYPSLNAPQKESQDVDEKLAVMLTRFHVNSIIRYRYSRTVVTALYKNPTTKAKTASFSINIPESAFISNFSMIVNDEETEAPVLVDPSQLVGGGRVLGLGDNL